MGISYGEIVALKQEFDKQCEEMKIEWVSDEVKQQAFDEFVSDYEDGNEEPKVMFCGYGYEKKD